MTRTPLLWLAMLFPLAPDDPVSARLQPKTVAAWERYRDWVDAKVQRELSDPGTFLLLNTLDRRERSEVSGQLHRGEIAVRKMESVVPKGVSFEVPDGTIHHWYGVILIRDARLPDLIRFVQDYEHHAGKFKEVEKSRLLGRDGDTFRFFLRLRRTQAPITVYYNTEQSCSYRSWGADRASSHSVAEKIAELENPGTPREREKSHEDDWGFLWRLETWWRFQQDAEGITLECESLSLSRDIPLFLKIIPGVMGYINSVPRESLKNTLSSIREHVPRPGEPAPDAR